MNLILFTANYPYGFKEPFLALELEYISKAFEKIYVMPCSYPKGNTNKRSLPTNVKSIIPFLSRNILFRIARSVFNNAPAMELIYDFFRKRVFLSYSRLNRWGNDWICCRTFLTSKHYKLLQSMLHDSDVLYFYWGVGAATIIPFLSVPNKIVLRLHGGDAWPKINNRVNYLPLRQKIYSRTNLILTISEGLKKHLEQKYSNISLGERIIVSRLGTKDKGQNPQCYTDELILVSCSNLIPLKRVEKIIDTLMQMNDIPLQWHHFGSGPLFNTIRAMSFKLPGNVRAIMHGQVSNDDILDFYISNHVDLFINVSSSEGVPVSIMEALSAGIIVVATNVGSTNEIVDNECGYLLDPKNVSAELSGIIANIRNIDFDKKRHLSRRKWESFFNAEANYNLLIKAIASK